MIKSTSLLHFVLSYVNVGNVAKIKSVTKVAKLFLSAYIDACAFCKLFAAHATLGKDSSIKLSRLPSSITTIISWINSSVIAAWTPVAFPLEVFCVKALPIDFIKDAPCTIAETAFFNLS